jgi:hypothetical protein
MLKTRHPSSLTRHLTMLPASISTMPWQPPPKA